MYVLNTFFLKVEGCGRCDRRKRTAACAFLRLCGDVAKEGFP